MALFLGQQRPVYYNNCLLGKIAPGLAGSRGVLGFLLWDEQWSHGHLPGSVRECEDRAFPDAEGERNQVGLEMLGPLQRGSSPQRCFRAWPQLLMAIFVLGSLETPNPGS